VRTAPTRERQAVGARELALAAHRALFNGDGNLHYFRERGLADEVVRGAYIGFADGAFTYPCIAREGGLLAVHCKSKAREGRGKRRQWWKGYADALPPKGCGRSPDDPAKVVPCGMESLKNLRPGALVVLACGEEDALSLRQAGYTALSQPGAGLLEPAYARELVGLEVVVFYDAGEEREACKDGLKLLNAGARSVRVVQWPPDAPHSSDINGRLVQDAEDFGGWAAKMISGAKPISEASASAGPEVRNRSGEPDAYTPNVPAARTLAHSGRGSLLWAARRHR
jgi:hypothetical protein